MTLCIIVAMWGEVWLLSQTITKAAAIAGLIKPDSGQSYRILAGASIMLSLGSLVSVMVGVHVITAGNMGEPPQAELASDGHQTGGGHGG